ITTFNPTKGAVGTSVVVTGTGFTRAKEVQFGDGGNSASFTVTSDTELSAVVPPGSQTGRIRIESDLGSASSSSNFTVLSTSPPNIVSFTPTTGRPGTRV